MTWNDLQRVAAENGLRATHLRKESPYLYIVVVQCLDGGSVPRSSVVGMASDLRQITPEGLSFVVVESLS